MISESLSLFMMIYNVIWLVFIDYMFSPSEVRVALFYISELRLLTFWQRGTCYGTYDIYFIIRKNCI